MTRRTHEPFVAIPRRVYRAALAGELTFSAAALVPHVIFRCWRDGGDTTFKLGVLLEEIGWPWGAEKLRLDLRSLAPKWIDVDAPKPGAHVWRVSLTGAELLREGPSPLELSQDGGSFDGSSSWNSTGPAIAPPEPDRASFPIARVGASVGALVGAPKEEEERQLHERESATPLTHLGDEPREDDHVNPDGSTRQSTPRRPAPYTKELVDAAAAEAAAIARAVRAEEGDESEGATGWERLAAATAEYALTFEEGVTVDEGPSLDLLLPNSDVAPAQQEGLA